MRFDLDPDTPQISYKLLTACVTPRPIAWVSSLSTQGVVNAAPYSFFNAMGHTPPTVAIGILADPEKGWKDTARNILDNSEFVVNLVSEDLGLAMNQTCINAPADVSEMEIAGLQSAPSTHIKPPRIAGAPVSFECVTHTVVTTGPCQAIVIGQVRAIHIEDRFVLDAERAHIDTPALGLIGRMHGAGWYTRSADQFQLDRPDYATWAASQE
jgi:flavin reductase (DIM6/NTAB) family NADH-FMN oxidoreductase RutF